MKNDTPRAGQRACPATYIHPLLAMLVAVLAACSGDTLHHTYKSVDPKGWDKSDSLHFRIDHSYRDEDSCQWYIGIRHRESYPYRDIWLAIGRDTVHLYLADEQGQWLGNGIGQLRQLILPVRLHKCLQDTAARTSITHLMQHNPLPGISDIGIRIDRKNHP